MTTVSLRQKFPVPAQMIWSTIGGFNTLPDWHPAIEKSDITKDDKGTVRTLHLVGGGTIVERLETVDEKERLYTYSILEGPLPVANYKATIRVLDDNGGCTVEWSSDFEASGVPESDASKVIRGIYEAGFENLKKMFGG